MISNDVPPKKVENPCVTPKRCAIPGKNTYKCQQNSTGKSDLIHHTANIICCWLTRFYTWNKPIILFQVISNLLGIKY